jgi:hypothetical protein
MQELIQGDPSAYIRQNNRNLVMARLAAPLLAEANPTTTLPTGVLEGEMYVVGVTDFSATVWATASQHDLAIALSDQPSVPEGWVFITPVKGMVIHNDTNMLTWNGTAWVTMVIT